MAPQQNTLLRSPPVTRRPERRRVSEVAGHATADCAAVCCCLPCAAMDMLILAAFKVPAGLVKKAIDKRKRQLRQKKIMSKKEALLDYRSNSFDNVGFGLGPRPIWEEPLAEEEMECPHSQLEEEMWAQFNGTGFWRSSSQRYATNNNQHSMGNTISDLYTS
ncbi:hypothetical protein RJT34_28764 [Clitoria ternatea]|uniref:Uncharacterized protein n=1 Tax=Clitoria ternatea TaxID=43366 RepID=A0AAN9FBM8_CLITE